MMKAGEQNGTPAAVTAGQNGCPGHGRVTSLQIKIAAIVTMFIDHIAAVLVVQGWYRAAPEQAFLYKYIYWTLKSIGRIAFPLFVFMLAEGFLHTRSRVKYFGRLLLFALISELPYDIAFNTRLPQISPLKAFVNRDENVIFTLTIGFVCIWVIHRLLSEDVIGKAAGRVTARLAAGVVLSLPVIYAGCRLARFMHTDYSWGGVLAVIITYIFLRFGGRREGFIAGMITLICYNSFETVALLGYPLIAHYSGKRGKYSLKWFFYWFYPVHLFLLGLLKYFIFG